MDISNALWEAWLFYWFGGALLGAFVGSMLWSAAKAIIKKVINFLKEEDE